MTTPLMCAPCLLTKEALTAVAVIDGWSMCARHVAKHMTSNPPGYEGAESDRLAEVQGALSRPFDGGTFKPL